MKIAFICASLELGRDGVGDYTRRLAAGCTARGHQCRLFALNDRQAGATANEGDTIVRWSASLSWPDRAAALIAALARFAPDWVSWQFVGYGYNPRGVTPPALIALARQLRGFHSQVTLHELWIGLARGESAWARFEGWRQRRALDAFLRAVRPAHVQTSNASYAAALARLGWHASVQPVFSNIPPLPSTSAANRSLERHLPAHLAGGKPLVAVTFGTIHPQWQPEPTGRWLDTLAHQLHREPVLLAIGRTGPHAAAQFRQLAATGVHVVETGELPLAEVSALLQAADCGIALHPWALAGKSGAVAALRAHGLPVLFPRDDWHLRHGAPASTATDPRFARLTELAETDATAWLQRRHSPGDSFPAGVARFLESLHLKLLFYVPQMASYGGIELHVCMLAAAAARRGHHVTLLTTSNSLGADLRAELKHPRLELRELPMARRQAGKFVKLRWLGCEVIRARRESWDIIYTNGQSAFSRLVWLAARVPSRRIHHHHTAADRGEQATWSASFRGLLRQAPEIIACSVATRDAIQAAVRRTTGIHLPYVTRCPVEAGAVHERAPSETLHFGFLGRLIPEKGIDVLCRLSANPALAGITWHLHGTGEPYPPGFFAAWPGVVYHGAYNGVAEHARALLALDAVVLFSTHNEGMPLSLIEAMSAGLPWIATDRGGTRELVLSPPNALLVPHPAGEPALVAAVGEMARRIRAGETSRRAQRRAYDAHFAPAVTRERWLNYFEKTGPVTQALSA